MTKFLLDSGDPDEYRKIAELAKNNNSQLWGSTTNPTLIAKKLGTDKKYTREEAFNLQKEIILQIVQIVPGAVSAEVYADKDTKASEMIEQGQEIATWHDRVVVKLPTTVEGFKARTELRKLGITTNNTLVFSQEQIFAICLHEHIVQKQFGPFEEDFPPFISPFVGRLDDKGENGIDLVRNGMKIKALFKGSNLWMLEASVRSLEHIQDGIDANTELLTAPAKIFEQWFSRPYDTSSASISSSLKPIPYWQPTAELLKISTLDEFNYILATHTLNISHPLTDAGLERFAQDWQRILV